VLCETIFIEEFYTSLNEAPKAHYFCFLLLSQRSAVQQKSNKATLPNTKSFFYCKARVAPTIAMFTAIQYPATKGNPATKELRMRMKYARKRSIFCYV